MKILLILLLSCGVLYSYEYNLSLCAIFQNEAPYLKEWIDFHRRVGVEHFWLYNHLSTDNYKDVLREYIEKGIVELIEWDKPIKDLYHFNIVQCEAYNHAIRRCLFKTKWLAVVDTDEFIVPVLQDNLIEFLKDYEECACIGVNWQTFGTSHVPFIALDESMLRQLVWRAHRDHQHNLHIKCIVKPKYVRYYFNPHNPILKAGMLQVNPDKVIFQGPWSPYVSADKIRIHHYYTRDEYFVIHNKLPRRANWQIKGSVEEFFKMTDAFNEVLDTSVFKFLE